VFDEFVKVWITDSTIRVKILTIIRLDVIDRQPQELNDIRMVTKRFVRHDLNFIAGLSP
jgi:hypothetical protein